MTFDLPIPVKSIYVTGLGQVSGTEVHGIVAVLKCQFKVPESSRNFRQQ